MKLYYHPASTTSRIVDLFAREQGIELERQVVDLFTGEHLKPEYAAINPNCLVPVLEDGDFRLTESAAILRYLAEKTGSPAYPRDLKERARVNERMDWFNSNIYKDIAYGLIYPQTFPHHKRPSDAVQAGTLDWGKQKTQDWLKTLDQKLMDPNKPFLCGDQVTLADYMGAEMIALGEVIGCSYAQFPNIGRWLGRMKALKSWAKVHEAIDGFAASLKGKPFVAV
jgi:glutathione S-transferase